MKPILTLPADLLRSPLAALNPANAPKQKPNIIFFLIDDFGSLDLGCQGSTFYQTPNIDRLAKEGVRFTNAYAACAVYPPTRAAILTGKYPARLLPTEWLPRERYGDMLRRAWAGLRCFYWRAGLAAICRCTGISVDVSYYLARPQGWAWMPQLIPAILELQKLGIAPPSEP